MIEKKKIFYRVIFIVNILFILFLVGYYGYRLIHYYQLEHKKESELVTLNDYLTQPRNIVVEGDGLYQNEKEYYYAGKNVSNYVSYSGYLFRVIKIREDGAIVMTTDDTYTLLSWGEDSAYDTSYARKWLANISEVPQSGVFEKTLWQPEQYLVTTEVCTDTIANVKKLSCKKKIDSDYVGLFSMEDYQRSGGLSGFLNNGTNFWTSNASKTGNWFISNKGGLNENEVENQSRMYGVRPTITLKASLPVLGGSGSKEQPYIIENHPVASLVSAYVGGYVRYSGQMFRIIGKNNNEVRLALNGVITTDQVPVERIFSRKTNQYNPKEYQSVAQYLNQTYYRTLQHPEYLVEGAWNIGNYGDINYDYATTSQNTVNAKIGMLQVGDLFVEDVPNVFLLNGSGDEEMIYTITEQGSLYLDEIKVKKQIRPVLNMLPTVAVLSGTGTEQDPYVVGEA